MIGIVLYIIVTEGYRAQLKCIKVFITQTAAQGRMNSTFITWHYYLMLLWIQISLLSVAQNNV